MQYKNFYEKIIFLHLVNVRVKKICRKFTKITKIFTVINRAWAPKLRLDRAAPKIRENRNNSGRRKWMAPVERETATKMPKLDTKRVSKNGKMIFSLGNWTGDPLSSVQNPLRHGEKWFILRRNWTSDLLDGAKTHFAVRKIMLHHKGFEPGTPYWCMEAKIHCAIGKMVWLTTESNQWPLSRVLRSTAPWGNVWNLYFPVKNR